MNIPQQLPFFSIVTICFNNIDGLKRTHKSIENQSFQNYEWIIVDGNSTDETIHFLKTLSDQRYDWKSESDSGIYDAMNKGLEIAKGEYVIFMNSADEFATGHILDSVFTIINNNPHIGFLYGDSLEKDASGAVYNKKARDHKYIWYGMFTHHQAMFYGRKELSTLRYRENFKIGGDYALTSEFLSKDLIIKKVDFAICIYLLGGISSQMVDIAAAEQKIVWTNVLKIPKTLQWGIRFTQRTALLVRRTTPWIYNFFRFTNK